MATTFSPTSTLPDRPMLADFSPETPSALITARSVTGSVPTTVAFLADPSLKLTEIWPPWPATATTWLFVRISPFELITMPEPEPASCAPCTLILTTDGSTDFATASTELAVGATSLRFTTDELVSGAADVLDELLVTASSTAGKAAARATPASPP